MKLFKNNKNENKPATNDEPFANGATNASQPVAQRRRNTHPFVFMFLLLLVALLAAAATYMVLRFASSSTKLTDQTAQQNNATPAQPSNTAKVLIEEIKPPLKGKVVTEMTAQKGQSVTATDGMVGYSPQRYKPAGYDFITVPAIYYGITTTGNVSTINSDSTLIRNLLKDKQYEQIDVPNTANDTAYVYAGNYNRDNVRCSVAEYQYNNMYRSDIACADTTSYTDTAKLVQPLYEAMKAKDPTSVQGISYIGYPNIKNSLSAGYQLAETNVSAAVSGYIALHYKTPDNVWHFFKGTQQALLCSMYNTNDLKKAFLGEACYSSYESNTQSTVQL